MVVGTPRVEPRHLLALRDDGGVVLTRRHAEHRHWELQRKDARGCRRALAEGAEPQLPKRVPAPGEDLAARRQRHCVPLVLVRKAPPRHSNDVGAGGGRDELRLELCLGGVGQAELSPGVLAPPPELPALVGGEDVVGPHRQRHKRVAVGGGEHVRGRPRRHVPQPQLAVVGAAPHKHPSRVDGGHRDGEPRLDLGGADGLHSPREPDVLPPPLHLIPELAAVIAAPGEEIPPVRDSHGMAPPSRHARDLGARELVQDRVGGRAACSKATQAGRPVSPVRDRPLIG
mmetsp:Transcript_50073/g.160254  ORF Transcript_50073/g.160254 Transcript_50073/m.160254 type:complete len:286 (+) Transcript_50073:853-1710(+)